MNVLLSFAEAKFGCQNLQCLWALYPCVDGDQTASPAPAFTG
ncbi:hypothetical protein [Methanosarcina sp. MTP4]|nr:hypothetical protein [Methanosarcina sp. MTP4]